MEVVFDNTPVSDEFYRWLKVLNSEDPYDSTSTVGIIDVLRAHFLIADYFYTQGTGLGGIGPKSLEMLHSAVYRQFVSFGGSDKWPDDIHKAATLVFGIVTDHPFHDANKRTGLLTLLYALKKMKRVPTTGHRELEDLMVDVASGDLGRHARFREMQKQSKDATVLFLADYIKRNSRKIDQSKHAVTFQQLDQILKRFGFFLHNPSGNFIDVCKEEVVKTGLFGLGRPQKRTIKVCQIGFPSMKAQVNSTAIATVRKACGLTYERGFDSQTVFGGADPLNSLIAEYSAPLQRLAYR